MEQALGEKNWNYSLWEHEYLDQISEQFNQQLLRTYFSQHQIGGAANISVLLLTEPYMAQN